MKQGAASRVEELDVEWLREEHARIEMRLKELDRHLSLSPAEQAERAELKKTKLRLKDAIAASK